MGAWDTGIQSGLFRLNVFVNLLCHQHLQDATVISEHIPEG
jgi:hypothetical protein